MKLVKLIEPPCPCHSRLFAYQKEAAAQGRRFALGTEVQCDCGRLYTLRNGQRDGDYWQQIKRAA